MLTTGGGISGTIPDNSGGGIYVGSSPPSSALTQKVWFKTDGAGRPLGTYMFYNGNWRKVYTGAGYGMITMCLFYTGLFDGSGRGIIGGDFDGWAICNGGNGTPNMGNYTPVAGLVGEEVGGSAGVWYADADGSGYKNTGGQQGQSPIGMANLPAMVAHSHITAAQFGNIGPGYGVSTNDAGSPDYQLPVTDGGGNHGQSVPLPFPHLFMALGFLMFVGYQ